MKEMRSIFIILILIFSMGLIFSCFLVNSKESSKFAIVTIDTGINNQNRPLTNSETRAPAPGNITSISLYISAADMNTIKADIPLDTGILTLSVPVGNARQFGVTAETDSYEYYIGFLERNLAAEMAVNLQIAMQLNYHLALVAIDRNFPDGTPANIDFYTINITGPDMTGISETGYTPGNYINVPSGTDRQIELLAHTPSATFRGLVSSVTLTDGQEYSESVDMSLYETKLVIPDRENNRVVQIDDIDEDGSGWIVRSGSDLGYANVDPNDIDFDLQGRIYIAINTYTSTDDFIIRIDDINATNHTPIREGKGSPCAALAVDRNNQYLYYAASSTLYRCNLDGSSDQELTITGYAINAIRGIAVDDDGLVYIAGAIGAAASTPSILRYDPTSTNATTYTTGLNAPWDVIVKDSYIYAANLDTSGMGNNNKIIQLTPDLSLEAELYQDPDISDVFHGPHRFVATLNRRFYVIDEDPDNPSEIERIVAFDNIGGDNWEDFDPSMIGESAFQFYSVC